MEAQKLTVRQIRQILFNTNQYTVIGGNDDMSNKESRDYFYSLDNQDQLFNVIDNGTYLLIY